MIRFLLLSIQYKSAVSQYDLCRITFVLIFFMNYLLPYVRQILCSHFTVMSLLKSKVLWLTRTVVHVVHYSSFLAMLENDMLTFLNLKDFNQISSFFRIKEAKRLFRVKSYNESFVNFKVCEVLLCMWFLIVSGEARIMQLLWSYSFDSNS